MVLIKKIYTIAIGSAAIASTSAYASYLNRSAEIDNNKYKIDESKYRGVDYLISWDSADDSDGFLSQKEQERVKNDKYILGRCKKENICTNKERIRDILNKNRYSKMFDFSFS